MLFWRRGRFLLPIYKWPSPQAKKRLKQNVVFQPELENKVAQILERVKKDGDKALLDYTELFDGCRTTLRVDPREIKAAYQNVSPDYLSYLRQALKNIRDYHLLQKPHDWFTQAETGSLVGQVYRPLERVGIYVPGGTASYPSTVLMTALPAHVAGVREIVMVTPPNQQGEIPAPTLVAAAEAGVTEIYRLGGAQAIAALAYGTATIRKVDKIVGPGNVFVAMAKKLVFGVVGIDSLAGPSEILIIGEGSVKPQYAAADLLSQAEHDIHARAILLTPNQAWAEAVKKHLLEQLPLLPRREIAQKALAAQGAIILTEDLETALALSNEIAPEHLELLLEEPWSYLAQVKHAGAIFMGPYTPEPVGDYWAGPNHVLPTGGTARYAGVLSVADFYKASSILNYSLAGLKKAVDPVSYLAVAEGLKAHGQALKIRIKEEKENG